MLGCAAELWARSVLTLAQNQVWFTKPGRWQSVAVAFSLVHVLYRHKENALQNDTQTTPASAVAGMASLPCSGVGTRSASGQIHLVATELQADPNSRAYAGNCPA